MNMNSRQKEQVSETIRFILATVLGGVMVCFANFSFLTGVTDGTTFTILMLLIGILVGMYNSEVHYAILTGLAAIFIGFIIYYVILIIPIIIFASWELFDILILFGISSIVQVIMLQLLGMLVGVVLGRIIGPGWYESKIPKHKLKVGVPSRTQNTE